MAKKLNVNWVKLIIDLVKVLIGAFGGAVATATNPDVNDLVYNSINSLMC